MPNVRDGLLGSANLAPGSGPALRTDYAKEAVTTAPRYEMPAMERLYSLGHMVQEIERMRSQAMAMQLMSVEIKLNDTIEELTGEWQMLRRDIRTGSTR